MCIHLAEGKCVALEVKSNDPSVNIVSEFRKICGPRDPVSRLLKVIKNQFLISKKNIICDIFISGFS